MTGSTTRDRDSTRAKDERRLGGRRGGRLTATSVIGGATAVLLLAGLSLLSVPSASATPSTPISGAFNITVYTVVSSHSGGGNTVFTANLTAVFNGSISGTCIGPQEQSDHKGSNVSRLTGYCILTGSVNGATGTLEFHYVANDVRTYKHGISGQFDLVGLSGELANIHGGGTISDITSMYNGSIHFS
jgi:hypothetical protein